MLAMMMVVPARVHVCVHVCMCVCACACVCVMHANLIAAASRSPGPTPLPHSCPPPAGAMLTHANLIADAAGMAAQVDDFTPGDRHICYLPLAHIYERNNLTVRVCVRVFVSAWCACLCVCV